MEAFALYLFKSVVWLTGFALVYLLFLRNERYFLMNRIYLVAGVMASIIFPFFTWHYTIVIPIAPSVEVSDIQMMGVVAAPEPFPIQTILFYAYMAGALYLLYRIIRQTITVIRVIRQSEIHSYRSAKLIRTDQYPASFSFFSFVFVNPSSSDTETNEIVNHELEHVRQRHWIDLLLFELLCTLQWLNPVCWLYGRFIRQNHEYLADQLALQRTANPAIYRAALINQLFGGEVISLANSFNYSINNKRFHMMKNTINSPIRKLKLLLILPIIAGVFYAFATPEYKYSQAESNQEGGKSPHISTYINGTLYETTNTESSNGIQQVKDLNGNAPKEANDSVQESVTIINGSFVPYDSKDFNSANNELAYNTKKVQGFYKNGVTRLKADKISINLANTTHLVIIDGKEATKAEADNLNPQFIKSVAVLEGVSATTKYGDKGKNGVMEITRKEGAYIDGSRYIKVTDDKKTQKVSKVYTEVEQMPEFPGGDAALSKFIVENIKYPADAMKNGIQGKVYITFVVDKTGKAVDANVVRGINASLDQEALRVVGSLPQWKPGKQGGKDVDTQFTIPINFALAKTPDKVYENVEEMPEFPGGDEALRKFIGENVRYPMAAKDKNIQGKVFVSFVVDKTGKVVDPKIVREVDPSLDKEALRVVQSMPLWKPGTQGGKAVDVQYTIPINFVLEKAPDKVYEVVEQMPEFPGGDEALRNFIASNVKYPAEASKKGIQGKVFITFVVTKTGSVTNAKVVRGVDPSLDQEALRVVNLLPKWIPGKEKGVNVDVSFTVPINFVLKKAQTQADPSTQKGKLIIMPTPSKKQATVMLEGSTYGGKLEISIYDSFGKLMQKESNFGPSFTIFFSSFTPGNYLVVASDGTKQYQGNLIVIP